MEYVLSKNFEKQFKKLPKKLKEKVIAQLELFVTNPVDKTLSNHKLSGEWVTHRSINITGDIRTIYNIENKDLVRFVAIGSHSELYE
jgi:addiction module RelE/StbE family toxin